MALSATFTANFASFFDAVDKADAKLKDFGQGADKVGVRLNTLANQFSGQKIVQEATIMAKAVEEIGGVSKLTEKELARLGSTATEAVEKMKKLGMDVPKNLQEIADKTKSANQATTDWAGSLTKMAGALGVTFSVGAITSWISSTIDAASHVEDLSRKLDVSHEAIQRWGYAAELSGATIDDVSSALAFMNKTLAGGSDSTVAALQKAGLSFQQVRDLSPEDAFDVITEAIKNIPDPMDQARVATELFGKGASTILPAIRDGFREVGKEAAVMSDDMIASLDAAGDTWTRFKNKFVVASASIIALATDTDHIFQSLILTAAKLHDTVGAGLVTSVPKLTGVFGAVPPVAKPATQALTEFNAVFDPIEQKRKDDATKAIEEHTRKIQALADVYTGRALAAEIAKVTEGIAKAGGVSRISAFQLQELAKQAKTFEDHGGTLSPVLVDIKTNFLTLADAGIKVEAGFGKLLKLLPEVKLAARSLAEDLAAQDQAFANLIARSAARGLPNLGIAGTQDTKVNFTAGKAITETSEWSKQLAILSQEFQKLGSASGGTLGEMLGAVGQMIVMFEAADQATRQLGIDGHALGGSFGPLSVMFNENATAAQQWGAAVQTAAALASGAMDVWTMSANQGSAAMNALGGAAAGAKAGAAFGAYGMMIGAATGATIGWVRSMDDGREAVEQFANRNGGFDELHKRMAALGAEGEAMWKQITQGINRGNTDQAIREIKKIEGALTDLARKTEREFNAAAFIVEQAMKRAADAAKAAADEELQVQEDLRAAIKEYGFTIDELGPKWRQQELDAGAQKLLKSYSLLVASGINVVTVQTRMADSINDYLHDALRTGATIPEAWKPILESMAAAGQLTDENGEKLTDLSRISWSQSLGEKFDSLAEKLQKILNHILGIPETIKTVNGQIGAGIVIPVTVGGLVGFGGAGTATPGPVGPTFGGAQAAGGDYLVTRPTLFLAGEAGPERATFSGAGRTGRTGGGVTVNIHNPVVRERQDLDRMADLFARRLQERGL